MQIAFLVSHSYEQLYIGVFIAGVPEGAKLWRAECKKEPMHSWSYNNLLVVGAQLVFPIGLCEGDLLKCGTRNSGIQNYGIAEYGKDNMAATDHRAWAGNETIRSPI